jgi:hypothetical protein
MRNRRYRRLLAVAAMATALLLARTVSFGTPISPAPTGRKHSNTEVAEHGTLLVFIPTKDGLVVASDSRMTFNGTHYCDEAEKFIPLVNHPRSLLAAAGNSGFGPAAGVNPCKYVKQQTNTNLLVAAKTFLDEQHGNITWTVLRNLEAKALPFFRSLPEQTVSQIQPESNGVIFTLKYAHYDSKNKVSVLGTFDVCLDKARAKVSICKDQWKNITQSDTRIISSQADECISQRVLSPAGRRMLGPDALADFDDFLKSNKTVGETTTKESLAAAVSLISATARITELNSNTVCFVGLPVRAVLLDGNHREPFKLLP